MASVFSEVSRATAAALRGIYHFDTTPDHVLADLYRRGKFHLRDRVLADIESRRLIEAEIDELTATEYLVATNEGTYGAAECCRKVGCGDPQFGNVHIYETVGGVTRRTGPDDDQMPGRLIRYNADGLKAARKRLAALRKQLLG